MPTSVSSLRGRPRRGDGTLCYFEALGDVGVASKHCRQCWKGESCLRVCSTAGAAFAFRNGGDDSPHMAGSAAARGQAGCLCEVRWWGA